MKRIRLRTVTEIDSAITELSALVAIMFRKLQDRGLIDKKAGDEISREVREVTDEIHRGRK